MTASSDDYLIYKEDKSVLFLPVQPQHRVSIRQRLQNVSANVKIYWNSGWHSILLLTLPTQLSLLLAQGNTPPPSCAAACKWSRI